MLALDNPLALFIVQAIVIIAAARLVGIAARWVGQPMVIAEIVAGIVLGPSLLGLVAPDTMATLFPRESLEFLGLMSQMGLVLFMFLVGLELDLTLLSGRGRSSVVISHSSIFVPFMLGLGLAFAMREHIAEPGVSFSSFALFMGVAMSITAFPVLARILSERQLMRTRVGSITIACAAVDDITAWCILAFVVSIVRASGLTDAVWTTVLAIAYVALMLTLVRPLLRRIDASGGARTGPSQNLIAVIFVGLLLSAWTTELIGIHALFGAFMFGAIVPKQSGFARALAEKLEDTVVVFLLPMFFAYSGLRTHIGLLESAWDWTVCALVILVACVGKFGGSAIPARLTGLNWRESTALGILMNTRGLMELVVLNIGLDLGVISPRLFTMLVIMALFTTFVTTPLLQLVYPIEQLKRELIRQETPLAPVEPAPAPGGMSLLVCIADDRSGPPMVDLAAGLVGRNGRHSELYALHLRRPPERTSSYLETSDEPAPSPTRVAARRAEEVGLKLRAMSFVSTDPARDICDVADVKAIDLVMLGWHRPLLGAAHLGGVVHEVLEDSGSNVAVLVNRGGGPIARILVPFADSVHDRFALELARRLHLNAGAAVTVLHVVAPTAQSGGTARTAIEEAFPPEGGAGPPIILRVVESHDPAQAALDASAGDYDLVVVGVGREWGMPQRQFGLRTERLLERSKASLLVVRATGDATGLRLDASGVDEPATPASLDVAR
jgi:Kef-type K+ transport system membrane component KefB/nucleotide-binding universal stress UspA family protein